MKITNNYSPHFGTVIATDKAIAYMNKVFTPKQVEKANKIIANQEGKQPNIHLHLGSFKRPNTNKIMYYLRAMVEDRVYKESLFTSSFGVLKKSAKYVDSFQKKV